MWRERGAIPTPGTDSRAYMYLRVCRAAQDAGQDYAIDSSPEVRVDPRRRPLLLRMEGS
jgi:hypothetical protein